MNIGKCTLLKYSAWMYLSALLLSNKTQRKLRKIQKTSIVFSSNIHPTCCIHSNTPVIMRTSSLAHQYTPRDKWYDIPEVRGVCVCVWVAEKSGVGVYSDGWSQGDTKFWRSPQGFPLPNKGSSFATDVYIFKRQVPLMSRRTLKCRCWESKGEGMPVCDGILKIRSKGAQGQAVGHQGVWMVLMKDGGGIKESDLVCNYGHTESLFRDFNYHLGVWNVKIRGLLLRLAEWSLNHIVWTIMWCLNPVIFIAILSVSQP